MRAVRVQFALLVAAAIASLGVSIAVVVTQGPSTAQLDENLAAVHEKEAHAEVDTARYGKGNEVNQHDQFSDQPQMYVFYLRHGNARRFVEFVGEGMNIQLDLKGGDGDMSKWALFYENIRKAAQFEKDKAAKKKGAL